MTPTQRARYTLRNCDKIMASYGHDFFEEHIKESIDAFFRDRTLSDVEQDIDNRNETFGKAKYPMLTIPDIADASGDGTLDVCITGRDYNVYHLAFLGMAWA